MHRCPRTTAPSIIELCGYERYSYSITDTQPDTHKEPSYYRPSVHIAVDHRCGLEVTSLLLIQRARVRSPVGPISFLRFFPGFFLNGKTNFREFRPHSSPVIIWPSYIIHLRAATVSDHGCSTRIERTPICKCSCTWSPVEIML